MTCVLHAHAKDGDVIGAVASTIALDLDPEDHTARAITARAGACVCDAHDVGTIAGEGAFREYLVAG